MMDFFNTSKKKLDIKHDNTELKNFNEENNKFTNSQNAPLLILSQKYQLLERFLKEMQMPPKII